MTQKCKCKIENFTCWQICKCSPPPQTSMLAMLQQLLPWVSNWPTDCAVGAVVYAMRFEITMFEFCKKIKYLQNQNKSSKQCNSNQQKASNMSRNITNHKKNNNTATEGQSNHSPFECSTCFCVDFSQLWENSHCSLALPQMHLPLMWQLLACISHAPCDGAVGGVARVATLKFQICKKLKYLQN